jgi:hypothetical protein
LLNVNGKAFDVEAETPLSSTSEWLDGVAAGDAG